MFRLFKKEKIEQKVDVVLKVDFEDINSILKYFQDQTGITFDNKKTILKNKATIFCKHRDIYSFDELLKNVKSNLALRQELINYLTTNETFFYREFQQIENLVKLIKISGKKVDILCAPSSTGEEPYSIAIALLEAGIKKDKFKIVGIDINSQAINQAKKAIYKEKNLRNMPKKVRDKYFYKENDSYVLSQVVKSLVIFKVTNIFDSSFTNIGKFDYIFSRNMLIYFDKQTKKRAKAILEGLRKDSKVELFWGHADLF
jgi:chemotaxis protein methyltransferase CheR